MSVSGAAGSRQARPTALARVVLTVSLAQTGNKALSAEAAVGLCRAARDAKIGDLVGFDLRTVAAVWVHPGGAALRDSTTRSVP